jgi:hypothetical protein
LILVLASRDNAIAQKTYERGRLNLLLQDQDYEQAIIYLQSVVPSSAEETQYLSDLGYAFKNKAKAGYYYR